MNTPRIGGRSTSIDLTQELQTSKSFIGEAVFGSIIEFQDLLNASRLPGQGASIAPTFARL